MTTVCFGKVFYTALHFTSLHFISLHFTQLYLLLYTSPTSIKRSQSNPQNSGYCLSMIICFLLGVTYLLPFYILIQPTDYWNLQSTSIALEFYIVLVYLVSSFLCSVGMIFVPDNAYNLRIVSGLLLQAVCLAVVPMLPYFYSSPGSSNEVPGMFGFSPYSQAVLICTGLCGLATSVSHGSVLYLSAQFPGGIQRSLQLGMGLSPIVAVAIRIGTFYFYSFQDTVMAAAVLFFVASLLCLITSIAFQG